MKISWYALTLALLFAGIIHIVAVLGIPQIAPRNAWTRLSTLADPNTLVVLPRPSSAHQSLPMMAPDMRYAICRYDLSRGPVRVSTQIPDELWIIAFYAPDGSNFYTISGGDIKRDKIDIIVSTQSDVLLDEETSSFLGAQVSVMVTAPQNFGLVMIRAPLKGAVYAERTERALRRASCGRVLPGA